MVTLAQALKEWWASHAVYSQRYMDLAEEIQEI